MDNVNLLSQLSDSLVEAVERAQVSLVHVKARRRHGASGLVWREDGLILTADHAIEREDEITVGLPDGRDVSARLVGRDPGTDIAVVRVEAGGLTALRPTSSEAKTGQLVLALGRPFTGAAMASLGVISAVGGGWRTWRGGQVDQVVRSDVTLYPGFSGGPLIDATGSVIGMNTSILARGLAVTLPSAFVARVADALTAQGRLTRGYIGVTAQPVELPTSLRQALGLTQERGLLIAGIEAGSPADQAGLLIGDILVSFAGRATNEIASLQDALVAGSAGSTQVVRVVRGGQLTEINVTVGER